MKTDDPVQCENFNERLPRVTLVTDPNNFVSSPIGEQAFSPRLIKSELTNPWDLEFLPDGSMLITEKGGKLIHLATSGKQTTVLELDVINELETGLMGLAVDPAFPQNGFVYVMYGYGFDHRLLYSFFNRSKDPTEQRVLHRVSRLTFKEGSLQDEVVLLDSIPGSLVHSGGRLEFGPDGKLYASTGDAGSKLLSQFSGFLGGKILRMNTDGSIPEDNPTQNSYVFSRGHRNPQGMAWQPETGELYISEHGPTRFDEINRIVPGKNHGWGTYKCNERISSIPILEEVYFPVLCFRHWNISPSGMEFVSDRSSSWYGSLFVAGLRGAHLHRFFFHGNDLQIDEIFYISDNWDYTKPPRKNRLSRRIRDVEFHKGALYVIGDEYGIVELTPRDQRAH